MASASVSIFISYSAGSTPVSRSNFSTGYTLPPARQYDICVMKPLDRAFAWRVSAPQLGPANTRFLECQRCGWRAGRGHWITFGFAKLGHPCPTEPRNASSDAGCSNEMLQKAGLANKDGKYSGEARHRAGAGGRG